MLPTHLPLKALATLIDDHSRLIEDQSDEFTPLEMLTGYDIESGTGAMPFECEEGETDPKKRLEDGEELAIQLHNGMIDEESRFIDGGTYTVTEAELSAQPDEDDEDYYDNPSRFPGQESFYALGIRLEGDKLLLRPVTVGCGMNGESVVSEVVFPESLVNRLAEYLGRLA